jgi:Na+-transporting NADH:ubiquinone oxidoreductase subunit C
MKIKKEKIYPVIYMFLVTFIFIGFLTILNFISREKIKQNENFFKITAIIKSSGLLEKDNIPANLNNLPKNEIKNIFDKNFSTINIKNKSFYILFNNENEKFDFDNKILKLNEIYQNFNLNKNEIINKYTSELISIINNFIDSNKIYSFVFEITAPGLWGEIIATIGIKPDFKTIEGIEFLVQNETPGLGGRISEDWYKKSFKNKEIPLKIKKDENEKGNNSVEAITGATITSNYVINIFNKFLTEEINLIFNK